MELRYTITEEDYLDFNLFHANHRPGVKRARLSIGLLVLMFLRLLGFIREKQIPLYLVLLAGVFLLICIAFGGKIYRKAMLKHVKKQLADGKLGTFVGERTLTLYGDTIKETTSYTSTEVACASVQHIKMDDSRLYMYTDSNSAFLVPFSAFQNVGEKHHFIALITQGATNLTT